MKIFKLVFLNISSTMSGLTQVVAIQRVWSKSLSKMFALVLFFAFFVWGESLFANINTPQTLRIFMVKIIQIIKFKLI